MSSITNNISSFIKNWLRPLDCHRRVLITSRRDTAACRCFPLPRLLPLCCRNRNSTATGYNRTAMTVPMRRQATRPAVPLVGRGRAPGGGRRSRDYLVLIYHQVIHDTCGARLSYGRSGLWRTTPRYAALLHHLHRNVDRNVDRNDRCLLRNCHLVLGQGRRAPVQRTVQHRKQLQRPETTATQHLPPVESGTQSTTADLPGSRLATT